jgi:hypothetical protein
MANHLRLPLGVMLISIRPVNDWSADPSTAFAF